jgi:hypothetical protein
MVHAASMPTMAILAYFSMFFFCLAYSSTMKVEAICISETSVFFQRTTRRYIPEDINLKIINDSINILWQWMIYYFAIMCDIAHCLRFFSYIYDVSGIYSAPVLTVLLFCCMVYLSL